MPISSASIFHLPFASGSPIVLTQGTGGGFSHTGRLYYSLDFALANRSTVYAIGEGVVVGLHNGAVDYAPPAGSNGSTVDSSLTPLSGAEASMGPGLLGNFVTVRHLLAVEGGTQDVYVTYAHLSQNSMGSLQVGSVIGADQPLGQTGLTGAMYSSNPLGSAAHLHIQFGTTLRALGDSYIASAVDIEASHAFSYFSATEGGVTVVDTGAAGFFSNAAMATALQIEAARDGQQAIPTALSGFAHSGAQLASFSATPVGDRVQSGEGQETRFELTGFEYTFDPALGVTSFSGSAEVTLSYAVADPLISYTIIGLWPSGLPRIAFAGEPLVSGTINGTLDVGDAIAGAGRVINDGVAYDFLNFFFEDTGRQFFVPQVGQELPEITTLAQVQDFFGTASYFGAVPTGEKFAPDKFFRVSDFAEQADTNPWRPGVADWVFSGYRSDLILNQKEDGSFTSQPFSVHSSHVRFKNVPDGSVFSYDVLQFIPESGFSIVSLNPIDGVALLVDGQPPTEPLATLIGRMTDGDGVMRDTLLLITRKFEDGAENSEFLVVLSGPPLPDFASVAEFEAWRANTTIEPITDGPYAPGQINAFDRPALDIQIEVVSVSAEGVLGDRSSEHPDISADGRYVAFTSFATNLTADDNIGTDIFVYDRYTGIPTLVSISDEGEQLEGYSFLPRITSDGRKVAFYSTAENLLVEGEPRQGYFLRDVSNNSTEVLLVFPDGEAPSNSLGNLPSISSRADIYAFDTTIRESGESRSEFRQIRYIDREDHLDRYGIASLATDGGEANSWSDFQAVSADGRFIAFRSNATNLVPSDENGFNDIFLHDRDSATTSLVSVADNAVQANGHSTHPAVSADGRYIAFVSSASNLVANDGNEVDDIFVHDSLRKTTVRISEASNGSEADGKSFFPSISGDGRFVVFVSEAANLAGNDANGTGDVFIHDLHRGITERLSRAYDFTQTDAPSYSARISQDGRFVTFASFASNLVPDDSNQRRDIFVVTNPLIESSGDIVPWGVNTPYSLRVGGEVTSWIETSGMNGPNPQIDSDWFRVALEGGRTYRFTGEADASPNETLDAIALRLYADNHTVVSDLYEGMTPDFTFTAPGSGPVTYYLAVSAGGDGDWQNKTGLYRLGLDVVDAPTEIDAEQILLTTDLPWEVPEDGVLASALGATIEVRHPESGLLLLRIEDGSVLFTGSALRVDGKIFGAAPTPAPIMDGSFLLDVETLKVTEFHDRDSSASLRLGGMVETIMSDLRLTENSVVFSGDLRLSDQFSVLSTTGAPVAFVVDDSGVQLLPKAFGTGRWLVDEPFTLELPGGGGVDLSLSDLYANYSLGEDAFYLGGKGALTWGGQVGNQLQLFGINRSLTLDLAGEAENADTWERGEKFIRIQRIEDSWHWDLVGELTYSASSSIGPSGFSPLITHASMALDTIDQNFGGSITAKLPVLRGTSLSGEFSAFWDPLQMESISFSFDDAHIPLAATGLMLTGGSIGISGMSGRDAESLLREYEIGADFQLATPSRAVKSPFNGQITGTFGNESIKGEIELKSIISDILPDVVVSQLRAGEDASNPLIDAATKWFGVDTNALLDFEFANLTGEVELGLSGGTKTTTLNGSFLNGSITGKVDLQKSSPDGVDTLDASGSVTLKLPENIALGGGAVVSGNVRMRFNNDGNFSNDYIAAWTDVEIGWGWATTSFNAGFQVLFDGTFNALGRDEIALIGSWLLEPEMNVVVLSANWEELADDVSIIVITPEGDRIHESEFHLHDAITIVSDLNGLRARHIALHEPETGIWDIEVVSASDLGHISYSASDLLAPSEIQIVSISSDSTGNLITIEVEVALNEQQDAILAFYAIPEGGSGDKQFLGTASVFEDGTGIYPIETSALAQGTYRIEAELSGSRTVPIEAFSSNTIQIAGVSDISLEAFIGELGDNEERLLEIVLKNEGTRTSGQVSLEMNAPEDLLACDMNSGLMALQPGLNTMLLDSIEPGARHVIHMRLGDFPSGGTVVFVATTRGYELDWTNNYLELAIPAEISQDPIGVPIARDDSFNALGGIPFGAANVLANDSDPDGDPLTVIGFTYDGTGTLDVRADGTFSYLPAPDAVGTDSFTYTIADSFDAEASATVTLHLDEAFSAQHLLSGVVSMRDSAGPVDAEVIFRHHDGPTLAAQTADDGTFSFLLDEGAAGTLEVQRDYQPGSDPVPVINDVLALFRMVVGVPGIDRSPQNIMAGDYNQDGATNITDVLALFRFLVGVPDSPTPTHIFLDDAEDYAGVTMGEIGAPRPIEIGPIAGDTSMALTGIMTGNLFEHV